MILLFIFRLKYINKKQKSQVKNKVYLAIENIVFLWYNIYNLFFIRGQIKMKVQITGYTHKDNWYSTLIGKSFYCAKYAINGGITLFSQKYHFHHINIKDCKIINPKYRKS